MKSVDRSVDSVHSKQDLRQNRIVFYHDSFTKCDVNSNAVSVLN